MAYKYSSIEFLLQFLLLFQLCFIFIFVNSASSCSGDTPLAGFRFEFTMHQHQLRGIFTVLDNCSFRVSEFDMLQGSDVRWWGALGDDFANLTNGFVISDDKLNRTYKNDSMIVSLRSNLTWDQIKVVAIWDLSMASDFGHVVLHDMANGSESLAPAPAPAPGSDGGSTSRVKKWIYEEPTMFENCKTLSQNYRVRWTLGEENVMDIGLEAVTGSQNYMAFGWANPNSSSGFMLHADVAVTGFTEDSMPFAEDFYITDYSVCSQGQDGIAHGVCPDSIYNVSDPSFVNNTNLVYGHRIDGVSFIRYQRLLESVDKNYDVPVNPTGNMTVIWALGRIKPPDTIWPYYLPQNHGGPPFVSYGHLVLNVSENVNDCLGPLDAEDKDDQDLIIADAKVPLVVTSGPALNYPNPPNPSKVLYINKKEVPLLRVERGVPVKFSVQAGHDVALYITSDPLGGNATIRNVSETIYAGGAEFEGVPASPKELVWAPDRNTPDQVYYQSVFEQKMGWKVQVVDGGLSDMYNSSVVLDDQQVTFFWTLSENSISFAARGEKKSGYLAIGFGSGMVNSFAYVGWIDDYGKGHVNTYWIDGRDASSLHATNENLTYVRCKSDNGIITMEFTRPMKPSCHQGESPECSNIIDSTTPLKVIWAMGAKWSEDHLSDKNMHSAMSSRPLRVSLMHGSAEAEEDLRPVLAVHGFMMFLAWGIFLPGGVLAARYLKHVKGDGWYRFHVYLQYSGLSIVLLGFLFAVAELRGLYASSLHVKFGLSAIFLACAQPVNATLRPKKPESGQACSLKRLIWEYSHAIVGRCAILVGMASLITGMMHLGDRYDNDVRGLTWALIIWFLFVGLTVFYLEFREKARRSDGSSGRGNWVLGNIEDDDSIDLLHTTSTVADKLSYQHERMEVQLEPMR
ncbi:hypothetical protein Nepgr_012717 [Nepenthes gracilis]|uniref:Uncharacterized protein n=1 Tax=Nepenthes gracilis TaxID=150966 RepID=A0AAD3XNM2_NEPGR|nr:hypothetical protein Nepgr_012717 [Nepenthes gracilis]